MLFAVGWIGRALLMEFALKLSLKGMAPETSIEFMGRFLPKAGAFMGLFSTLTVSMGPILMFIITGGKLPDYHSEWGELIYIGAFLAVISYI